MPYPDKGSLNLKAAADKNGCVFQKKKRKKKTKTKKSKGQGVLCNLGQVEMRHCADCVCYECTKIKTDEAERYSKSSASGVKAFPYEPGFKNWAVKRTVKCNTK